MAPKTCAWCDQPARETLELKKGRQTKRGFVAPKIVPVCDAHYVQLTAATTKDARRSQ